MADVERLAEIQARREKITPGPWSVEVEGGVNPDGEGWSQIEISFDGANSLLPDGQEFSLTPGLMMGDHEGNEDDAEFIAAAPADVDWLIAEIDRLREIVNSQKTKPEYRAVQRKARNDRHRADFLQRKADRLAHDLAEANAALSAAEARVETLQRENDEAFALCGYALHLAQYGERAPGGNETWAEFERRLRALVAAVPGKPQPTEET